MKEEEVASPIIARARLQRAPARFLVVRPTVVGATAESRTGLAAGFRLVAAPERPGPLRTSKDTEDLQFATHHPFDPEVTLLMLLARDLDQGLIGNRRLRSICRIEAPHELFHTHPELVRLCEARSFRYESEIIAGIRGAAPCGGLQERRAPPNGEQRGAAIAGARIGKLLLQRRRHHHSSGHKESTHQPRACGHSGTVGGAVWALAMPRLATA
mmetsp:Transcript_128615/g.274399  ORF Transcript_128615/g.274399 Transcript_128615/m.274399 type:complete len:214 (-) Transcript_128615:3-644(-)